MFLEAFWHLLAETGQNEDVILAVADLNSHSWWTARAMLAGKTEQMSSPLSLPWPHIHTLLLL